MSQYHQILKLSKCLLISMNNIHFMSNDQIFLCVVGDSPMTRIMDLPKGYINQELSW